MKKILCALCVCLLLAGCGQAAPPPAPTLAAAPYVPSDFSMKGGFMACNSMAYELGVDVSVYQREIDWQQVAEAGIKFAFIRVGYRGYLDGLLHEDERWKKNYEGATAAGLEVGAYIFSQAVTVGEAREEAEYAVSLLDGRALQRPLVFDWEIPKEEARTATTADFTALAEAFRDGVKAAGYTPGVYFNLSQGSTMVDLLKLTDCEFWLAHYNEYPGAAYKVDYWQYSSAGTVPGISVDVDVDLHFAEPYGMHKE